MTTRQNILVTLLITVSSSLGFAKSEVVGVKGMVCAFCAQGITKKFLAMPEVEKVDVSLASKKVTLTYKEGKSLSHDKIESLLKESGYDTVFTKEGVH